MMRFIFTSFLCFGLFTLFQAYAQDIREETADTLINRALIKWDKYENISFDFIFKNSLKTGVQSSEFSGKCVIKGLKLRKELSALNGILQLLIVEDYQYQWRELSGVFYGDHKEIFKSPKSFSARWSRYPEEFIHSSAGIQDAGKLIEIIGNSYDLKITKETEIDEQTAWILEGIVYDDIIERYKAGLDRLNEESPESDKKLFDQVHHTRITIHKKTLLPIDVRFSSEKDGTPVFYQSFSNYQTDGKVADKIFEYEASGNYRLHDYCDDSCQLKMFLVKPTLPVSKKKYFQAFPEGRRLKVILDENGKAQFGDWVVDDIRELQQHLAAAASYIPRSKYHISEISLIVYADPNAQLTELMKLMQVSGGSQIRIRKIYLAVTDGDSTEEGLLAYFLPLDTGQKDVSLESEREKYAAWYLISLYVAKSGPEYCISDLSMADVTDSIGTVHSIASLKILLNRIKKAESRANFVLALGMYPEDEELLRKAAHVKDLVELLTLLSSFGADLRWEKIPPKMMKVL